MAKKKFSLGLTFLFGIVGLVVGATLGGAGAYAKANGVFGNRTESTKFEGVVYDDFQIHFMMLGNDAAGDSIYIKAGDTDILIDAGSEVSSYETTSAYIDKYCTDGKLEYVIATHGDSDHIAAFPKLLDHYETGIIINNHRTTKTTSTYTNMVNAFNKEVENGAKWYSVEDCYNNANGGSREYKLSDSVTMTILYNYYYFNEASDENDYSVVTLFTYESVGIKKYFFLGGDLEKSGEEKLAAFYDGSTSEKTLPTVQLYKAGHHGSKTSSNDVLLNILQPEMCVVCCCCGTNEYTNITENQFPTQQFIDRIAKWTDSVYVTSIYDSYTIETNTNSSSYKGVASGGQYIKTSGFKPMNGNIIVSSGLVTLPSSVEGMSEGVPDVAIGLACSNNTTKLKDSDWMKTKVTIDGVERYVRTMPSQWASSN